MTAVSRTFILEQIDAVSATRADGGRATVTLHLRDEHTPQHKVQVQGLSYGTDVGLTIGERYELTLVHAQS